jgi:hypothetical protein
MKNSIQFLSLSALLCTSSLFSYDLEKSDRESFLKAYGAELEKLPAPVVKDPPANHSCFPRDTALHYAYSLLKKCILERQDNCFETAGKLMARIVRNSYSDDSYFDKNGNPTSSSVSVYLEEGLELKEWRKNSGNFD